MILRYVIIVTEQVGSIAIAVMTGEKYFVICVPEKADGHVHIVTEQDMIYVRAVMGTLIYATEKVRYRLTPNRGHADIAMGQENSNV